jgi:hypothetical protein
MRLGTETLRSCPVCGRSSALVILLTTRLQMTSISSPNLWFRGLSTTSFFHWSLLVLSTVSLTLMAQPSLSVPLRQFELSQAVLDSYHDVAESISDATSLVNRPLPDPQPVSLPVSNPTKSFWIDSPGANPLAKEGSKGELTHEADVCVIGSGLTGVSAAWHLAGMLGDEKEERNVVVLEARDFCE